MLQPDERLSSISIHASARRATRGRVQRSYQQGYFYPRPPRGGRPALRAEARDERKFLSTPSARRATHQVVGELCAQLISIHALREEGDQGR